jgi:formate/nitrite transporter FocA (FNT family)
MAGAVMAALTWMLLAVRDAVAKMLAIFAVGYLLFAANLSHSIVSASVLFVGAGLDGTPLVRVLEWLILATVGNLVGGVGLVALYRIVQAKEKQRA